MEQWTLDEIARTTEQQAVRRRFDAQNLGWFRFLAWVALVPAVPGLIVALATRSWTRAALVGLSAALTWMAIRSVRSSARGRLATAVRASVSGWIIGWFVLQATLCVFIGGHSDAIVVCTMMFPLVMIGFRMLSAELLLLHLLVAAAGISGIVMAPPPGKEAAVAEMIMPSLVMNGMMFTVESLMSRRWKREIIRDWSERRSNAQEQLRMRDELHYAREVQLSMLPEAPPHLDWVDVAGLSLPASEVGGDYYDYLMVDDALAIVTGDVAGHGLASGIVLAALRGGFTLLRESLRNPAVVLERLHELVAQTSRRRMLVTCAVLLLDAGEKRATVASAGHPPLFLRRANGTVERLELFAPPLGVRLPLHIASAELTFAAGDIFVLHSDGVYESRNGAGDTYGLERLEQLIASCDATAAYTICDAIARDLEAFRAGVPQDDDVTVVVARIV